MVGDEKRNGDFCCFVPGLHCPPKCWVMRATGVGIFECGYSALEGQSLPHDGNTKDQATAKTRASAGFHDSGAGRALPLEGPKDAASGKVLSIGLVHRKPS